ncbi:Leng9 [Symbiodinium natans]|uniref:Leng9 protein n=1 Tax=Symbiodinium natans TaxID=878477 RepID=A0A812I5M1_9DINO|nr:Leng9 [Symbiodinium natans]
MAFLDSCSALAILPPEELVNEVQALRQKHDKAFVRWPQAHLRILWPFLPVRTALPRLEQLHDTLDAFSVELSEVRPLMGEARAPQDRAYVGLTPSDDTRRTLRDLVERLLEVFPECRADDEEQDFHVTLGQFPLREAERVVASHCVPLPLTWRCGSLALCARATAEESFRLVQSIPLRLQTFRPPRRVADSVPLLPSSAWCAVLEDLPLADAARTIRLLRQQGVEWPADWWHRWNRDNFSMDSQVLPEQPELAFCSLVGAAAAAASLRWAAVGSKAAPIFECRAVEEFNSNPAVNQECLTMPFQTATCLRHSDARLMAVGEKIKGKESGVAFWDLADLNEKPRFTRLRGQVQSIDAWEETVLVLQKGGSLSLHDLSDPRAVPTALGRKSDGPARDAHLMRGGKQVLAAFGQKVRVLDLEVDGESGEIATLLPHPVILPLDAMHVAIGGPSGCMIWDLRKSAVATEVPWPPGFTCLALAKTHAAQGLVAGGGAPGVSPVQGVDLRMAATREAHFPMPVNAELRAEKVFAGDLCFSAQLSDGSLAAWHTETHTALGWWPAATCLSQPCGSTGNWPGIAAAGAGRLRVALPGRKAPSNSRRARREHKAAVPPAPAKNPALARDPAQGSKPRLRTSEDVYNRLLHDERFHPAKVVVGYEDRFLGPLEVKLPDFRPGGDIPFHRVYYFREEEEVLWDRRARLDRIFATGDAVSEAAAAETQDVIRRAKATMVKIQKGIIKVRWSQTDDRKAKVEEIPVMKYSPQAGAWLPFPGAGDAVGREELRVLTLNVLFELFGDVETHIEARQAQIFQELSRCGADVMALQEVTPQFAAALLSQPWVREQCWSSVGEEQVASVDPSGQLILTRLPMESAYLGRISPHKSVVLASIPVMLGESRAVTVANLHLSADTRKNQQQCRLSSRQEQLRTCEALLLERSGPGDLALLLGDFNASPEVEPPQFRTNFVDVWQEANPDNPGHTFDPTRNSVARRVATAVGGSLEPRRLDRIYLHSDTGQWRCCAELVCTRSFPVARGPAKREAPDDWFASDHFGVLCSLRPSAADEKGPETPGCQVFVRAPEDEVPEAVFAALALQGRPLLEVVLLGSSALGIADAGSDVDLLACSAELTSSQYFSLALRELEGLGVAVEMAEDAAVPLLKFQAGGKEFEVQFARLAEEHLPLLRSSHAGGCDNAYETLQALLFEPGSPPQAGLSAALDAWALLRAAFAAGGEEAVAAFRGLAKEVKLWARQRQLLGTSFGFPGGFAWALLALAEVVHWFHEPSESRQDLTSSFYERLGRWEWPLAGAQLQKAGIASSTAQDLPVLWCPAGPKDRNALRSLTRGTARILQAQLQAASGVEGREGAAQSALELPQFLILSLTQACEGARSLLQRKALSILLEAERCAGAATVWPLTEVHTTTQGTPCVVLGCSGWMPTVGEQHALASSLRISQGIELEARMIPASSLRSELRSDPPATLPGA